MKEDIYHRPITSHGGNKYVRLIYGLAGTPGEGEYLHVDVYKVLVAFGVTCPAVAHCVKKLLCAGLRDKGDRLDDLKGAMDALFRAIEDEEAAAAAKLPLSPSKQEVMALLGVPAASQPRGDGDGGWHAENDPVTPWRGEA